MGNKSSTSSVNNHNVNHADNDNHSQQIDFSQMQNEPESLQQKASYYSMIKQGYQELVNAIIRPPRCQYSVDNLGPIEFEYGGKLFRRKDFLLINTRGYKLECSQWEPVDRPSRVLPCVIYMHGNSSARVECITVLSLVLSIGATLVAFDFAGSGLSGGEYVSLGFFEKDDLECVIKHLRESGETSTIALWGRSMGASTSLMHGERDPSIAAMVLDSSFASLLQLSEELVDKGRQMGMTIPSFIMKMVIRFIRSSIQKTANFDILELNPLAHADKCYIPAFFVAGEFDDFVAKHHSEQLYAKYAGDKTIMIVSGDHNSPRPQHLLDSVGLFLSQTLMIPEHWSLPKTGGAGYPPWMPKSFVGNGVLNFDNLSPEEIIALVTQNGANINGDLEIQNIGMTAERQANVRNALFNVMGQGEFQLNPSRGNKVAGSICLESYSAYDDQFTYYQEDADPTVNNLYPALPRSDLKSTDSKSHANSSYVEKISSEENLYPRIPAIDTTFVRSDKFVEAPINFSYSEWSCSVCTLLNPKSSRICSCCGTVKV